MLRNILSFIIKNFIYLRIEKGVEFSCELIIYLILIVLPLYGLYKSSNEAKQKKELVIKKLENLDDDLIMIKSNLEKEANNVENNLDEMKKKLQSQEEFLKRNSVIYKHEKNVNKQMISDLFNEIEEHVISLKNERNSFDDYLSKISFNNSNISVE